MIFAEEKQRDVGDGVRVLSADPKEVLKETSKDPLFEVTYRYLIKQRSEDGKEQCFVQTVTGLPALHADFISNILKNDDILCAGREYVCSFDTSKVGVFDSIVDDRNVFNKDNKEEQEIE